VIEHPDKSIIVSSCYQSAVINFRRDGAIKWILGAPTGWSDGIDENSNYDEGRDYRKYLLKPEVGPDKPFAWQYYQHAPMITYKGTDDEGNTKIRILLFDNSRTRALWPEVNGGTEFVQAKYNPEVVPDELTYSRAVEYEIIEKAFVEEDDQGNVIRWAGTIKQVWQYPGHPTYEDENGEDRLLVGENNYLLYEYQRDASNCNYVYDPAKNPAAAEFKHEGDESFKPNDPQYIIDESDHGCWPLYGHLTDKHILSTARSDADLLANGNVLITYSDVTHTGGASVPELEGVHARIIEVTKPGNEKVFDLRILDRSSQDDGKLSIETYRSERIPSLYPPYTLYFPSIYDGVDEWQNYITVQARHPADTVNVTVAFYNRDGTLAQPDTALCSTCTNPYTQTIEPYTKLNATPNTRLYGTGELQHSLFDGTAVVYADRPVIGMANAIGPKREAFNIYETATPREDLFFSKVLDGRTARGGRNQEWTSLLQVQNAENRPVTITVNVNHADGTVAATLADQVIPANGKFEIRPSAITGSTPTSGTIRVTTDGGKVAGMMKYQYGSGLDTESYSIYEANTPATVSYLPKLYDGFGGNKNYISVLYPGDRNDPGKTVTVTVGLYDEAGVLAHEHVQTLGKNQKLNTTPSFLMCGSIGCANFEGTAVITATDPVYASTNTISPSAQDPREAFNIYEAAQPAQTLLFPKIYDGNNGWENTVSIQNVDSSARTVTVEFYDSAGNLRTTHTETIPARGQFNFRPRMILEEPFNNVLIVTSDAPGSIAGVVRYERTDPDDPNIRCMTIYEGISR
jgi:hypothetical protein